MSPTIPNRHFVFATLPAFGHLRPEVSVACKFIREDPQLLITILAVKFLVPVVEQEVARAALPPDAASRVRVIGVGNADAPQKGSVLEAIPSLFGTLGTDMSGGYEALVNRRKLTCTATGNVYDNGPLPVPSMAIVDGFVPLLPSVVKRITPRARLVICWIGSGCSFISHYAPAKYGGPLELLAKTRVAVEAGDTESVGKAIMSELGAVDGIPYPNPEGVKMFDYEMIPQDMFPVRIPLPPDMLLSALRFGNELADAVVLMTTRAFQPKVTGAMQEWYEGELGKKAYYLGPQALLPSPSPSKSSAQTEFAPIFQFLDSHPRNSVILVSFGTLFYPADHPWRIEAVVNALLDTHTPFIFSLAAMMARDFSPDLQTRLDQHKLTALVAPFVPQREVLEHPGMAAFLTHGGVNSMHESIVAGVVNIFWPISADQPLHAGYMSQNLDCAFELIQVRTGPGAGPPMRGGEVHGTPEAVAEEFKQILSDIKGSVGQRKRRNLLRLRGQFLEAMKSAGEAETELKAVLKLGRSVQEPRPATKSSTASWSSGFLPKALILAVLSAGLGVAIASLGKSLVST